MVGFLVCFVFFLPFFLSFFFLSAAAAQILVTGCLGAYGAAASTLSGCEGVRQRAFLYPLLSCDCYSSWLETRNT